MIESIFAYIFSPAGDRQALEAMEGAQAPQSARVAPCSHGSCGRKGPAVEVGLPGGEVVQWLKFTTRRLFLCTR